MIKLHKILILAGIICIAVGVTLELVYWFYLKDLVWILLIYPPPMGYYWVKIVPYLGLLFLLIGAVLLIMGIWFYLRDDLDQLRQRKDDLNTSFLVKLAVI